MLEDLLDRKALLQRLPDQPGDVPITFADVRAAERNLGYRCSTPIAEGLRRFCAWFQQRTTADQVA